MCDDGMADDSDDVVWVTAETIKFEVDKFDDVCGIGGGGKLCIDFEMEK